MLLQKHAIVQVTKTNDQLSVTVEDDGKGFEYSIIKTIPGNWLEQYSEPGGVFKR